MKLILLSMILVLAGCEPVIQSEKCIKGVLYYTGSYHMTAAFKPDGTLYTCNGE